MALDLYEQTLDVLSAFAAAGVPYALAGGVALAVHGVPRATIDIDVLIPPEQAERALELAAGLGFSVVALPMRFADGTEVRRATRIAGEDALTLDLLLAGPHLASAWNGRQTVDTERGPVVVVSREGLIAMKAASGRPQDLADIERLRELVR